MQNIKTLKKLKIYEVYFSSCGKYFVQEREIYIPLTDLVQAVMLLTHIQEFPLRIFSGTLIILTEAFCGFPQLFQAYAISVRG
jgi:hypothetical protein